MQGMGLLSAGEVLEFPGFRLDRRHGGLFRIDASGAAVPVPLGSRALDILDVLARRSGELVSKQEIMDAVWPHTAVEENNLTVQMSALRRVLDQGRGDRERGDRERGDRERGEKENGARENGARERGQGGCIETVPGRGYRFRPVVTRPDAADPAIPRLATAAVSIAAAPANRTVAPERRRPRWYLGAVVLAVAALALAIGVPVLLRAVRPGNLSLTSGGAGGGPRSGFPQVSLVVLPFENLGGDPADGYLVEGITDDLTSDLANMPDTFVIARASADTYRGRGVDVRQVGRELGVGYVVEGSVRRLGPVLRINVQLISTLDGTELWAERFDQDVKDLAVGQGEIVARLRGPLGMHVLDSEVARRSRERPADPTAFDLYLRARALTSAPASEQRSAEQQDLLERALRLQPSFMRARLALAEVLIERTAPHGLGLSGDTLDRAQRLVAEAEAAEPDVERVLCDPRLPAADTGALGRGDRRVRPARRGLPERQPRHLHARGVPDPVRPGGRGDCRAAARHRAQSAHRQHLDPL